MLDQFNNRQIDLDQLVAGLESLLNVLEAPDKDWTDAFRREWGWLETVRATQVSKGVKEPPQDSRIVEEIGNIRRLLNRYLATLN